MPDLLEKLLEALGKKDIPAVCPISSTQEIPENAQMLGYVPEHLRQLYVLSKNMENAAFDERHRRCVAFFRREEYDSEQIEFMIRCDVEADPNFGGDGLVKGLFSWSLLAHFPQIPRGRYRSTMLYYLGPNWEVYAVIQERRLPDVLPFGAIIIDKK